MKEMLRKVMPLPEAAKKYGVSDEKLRQMCAGYDRYKKFFTESEARKVGRLWLIAESGMKRYKGEEGPADDVTAVLTLDEAAKTAGVPKATFYHALLGDGAYRRYIPADEWRNAEGVILVTRDGVQTYIQALAWRDLLQGYVNRTEGTHPYRRFNASMNAAMKAAGMDVSDLEEDGKTFLYKGVRYLFKPLRGARHWTVDLAPID